MTEEALRTFHDSFSRCVRNGGFFDRFYDRFLASSPEVAAKFARTDFRHQKIALKLSLYTILEAAARRNADYSPLRPIAERHARGAADIRPELYDLWLDALVATVADHDPHYDERVSEVWREALRPAIDYMISLY